MQPFARLRTLSCPPALWSALVLAACTFLPSVAHAQPQAAAAAEEPAVQLPAEPPTVSDPAIAPVAPLEWTVPVDPKIKAGRLDNGLRYWIRENKEPEGRAEVRLLVKTGSVLEDDDQLGLAHFVEHMAFNGTEDFPKLELVEALESFGMRFGADINASTGFDETIYWLRVPTDSEEIVEAAFSILENWAWKVSFDTEEVEKERGVVIEEWRLGLGAGSRMRDVQIPVLFRGSKYADRLPIGTLESLETFDPDALRRFYRDWYRPDLMAVIAVGDFDRDDVERRIREHFGRIPMPADARLRPSVEIPPHEETLVSVVTDSEATGSSVAVYHKLPIREQMSHRSYRQRLVENLYNGMFNRRLAELSQQPNPPFLGASSNQGIFIPTREVYLLGAGVGAGGVLKGLEGLFTAAERVARYGFTATELDRERTMLTRAFDRIWTERDTQPTDAFAEEFSRAFLEEEPTPGIAYEYQLYQRFLPEITIEEVNRVGQQWLKETDRVVLVTAPEGEVDSLPERDELLAAMEDAVDQPLRPYVDTTTTAPLMSFEPDAAEIVEESTIEELGVTEWKLSNGARVILKPTDFREDEILLHAFSPGGTSLASDDDYVAASTAAQVISAGGLGRFSAREVTNMLSGKVVEVRPMFGPLYENLVGGASPLDLETMFQLVYMRFTAPRAEPGVFDIMTRQIRASLANRDVSPEVAFQEELQRTLSQNHPRRRPISVEMIDEMDLDTSFDFYRDRFADVSDFTFVLVGNIDLEVVRPLVQKYVGSLPSIARFETWRDEGIDPPSGIVRREVMKGREPKSLTSIIFAGSFEDDRTHRNAIGSMGTVLQTRLRNVLREDLGGTYSVTVDASTYSAPEDEFDISITFGADPDRIDALSAVVFEQIEMLQAEGPTHEEVANVRESRRRSWELGVQENGFWLSRLVSAYREDSDPRDVLTYLDSLEEITQDAIREAAEEYFDFDNYIQVTLYPQNGRAEGVGSRR